MTHTPDNGGPAFPTDERDEFFGMSLRDYFAGQALAGILADPNMRGRGIYNVATRDAYAFADAMIAAREAKP